MNLKLMYIARSTTGALAHMTESEGKVKYSFLHMHTSQNSNLKVFNMEMYANNTVIKLSNTYSIGSWKETAVFLLKPEIFDFWKSALRTG